MIRRIVTFHIPLYAAALLALLFAAILAGGALYYYRGDIYRYAFALPGGGPEIADLQFGSIPALADINFFNEVKNTMVADKADFIEANLSEMKLTVFKGGVPAEEYPILTKGREGSWWETPAGLYRVETKVKNHFSNFAGVYLPWSMPFQGNFFIHGWPYYPDGTPVSSQYSGGCIRLSTEDAEKVYEIVKVGTPVLVFEKDFAADSYQYHMASPDFRSKSYLAADLKNNFVFAERNPSEKLPIASLTKLMTALVAVEYTNIEKEITVSSSMLVPTSLPRLKAGQRISLYNLLPLLLMESSNEAAVAISNFHGSRRFVDLMNQKAKAIGMKNTTFVDPSGKGDGNVSTVEDLFALAKYLYNNRSFILKTTRGEIETRVYGPLDYSNLKNFNGFGEDSEFVGGKVGFTQAAGETLLSIFEVKEGEEIRPVAVILLNSPDHFKEAESVRNWVKQTYR